MSDSGNDEDGKRAAFHWELMKLLTQVAWADDEIVPEERRVLMGLASRLSLTTAQVAELETFLEHGTRLPAPNMQLLRARRDEVLQAAEQIVMVDNDITDDENRVLAEIHTLLQGQ